MNTKQRLALAATVTAVVAIVAGRNSSSVQKLLPTMSSKAMKRASVVRIVADERPAPDPAKYWAEILQRSGQYPPHWCGALVLYALRKAGLTTALWRVGSGFIYELKLPRTNDPQPGDVAYFNKFQHHALVAENLGDGTIVTYDGNGIRSAQFPQGEIGRHVRRKQDVTAFFSIDPLLK
jgi:hypothetical protein